MCKFATAIAVALASLVAHPAFAAPPSYSVTVLKPEGSVGRFTDINNSGVIAGYLNGESVLRHPDGTLTTLPRRDGEVPGITAFGDNGAAALAYHDPAVPDRVLQGSVWRNGSLENLPSLRTIPDGHGYTVINAIGSDGRMAGNSATDDGFYDDYGNLFPYTHAVTYASGQLQDLGTLGGNFSAAYGINDRGEVVGVSGTAGAGRQSFIYRNGTMQALGGLHADYLAFDINDSGQVLANSSSSQFNAVLWEDGQLTEFSMAGFGHSTVSALNSHGQVIGRMRRDGGWRDEGFLYSDGELTLLTSLVGEPGWDIHEVEDINDAGQIVALGCRGFDCTYVLLTPVPEPSFLAMLGTGLAATGFAVRRRRTARNHRT